MNTTRLEPDQLEALRRLDSCSVANAIETFDVRLSNTGFTDSTVGCLFPELPVMVGYAATLRVRTSEPPMEGERYYYRLDWLDHVLHVPAPRILVVQDMDNPPGLGAFIGNVHANILRALGCVGVLTNGAVRHINEVKAMQVQMYVGNVSVSHAYAHVSDFGVSVEVGTMQVRPGDLLHGDRHGVQTIPLEIAGKVPEVALGMVEQEQEIIELCRSANFTTEKLQEAVAALRAKRKTSKP